MGFWDDLEDVASSVGDAVVDTAEAVVEQVEEQVVEVVEVVQETVEDVVDTVVETVVDTTTSAFDLGWAVLDTSLGAADEYIFDPVDWTTGGLVDIDYADGNLGGSIGLDGVWGAGATIGESGVGVDYHTPVYEFGAHVDSDGGFGINQSTGIDWGPLPYAEGHVEVDPGGAISVGGEVQATIPTPIGILDGSASGGFDRNEDGSWATGTDVDATLYTPSGAYGGEVHVAVAQEADGDTNVGVGLGGSYDDYAGTAVEADVGYQHTEDNGTTTDSVHVGGSANLDGTAVSANVDVAHTDSAAGSSTTVGVSGAVDADDMHAGIDVNYAHEESADGTTSDSLTVQGGVEADDVSVGVGVGYKNVEHADGSSEESFEAGVAVDSGDVHVEGGVGYGYTEDAQGNSTETVNVAGSFEAGDVSGGGEIGYERSEIDGTVTEHTSVGGEIQAGDYGASGSYDDLTVTAPDGTETSITETSGGIEGLDVDSFMELGNVSDTPLPDWGGDAVPEPVEMVGALAGSGDLSEVLGGMSVADGGSEAAIEAVSSYVEDGGFDDFTSDIVSSEVTEAAASDVWEDLG